MKREPFASAAGAKWRRYRALGLLAAGLVTAGNRQSAQTIAARLADEDALLTWYLDDVASRGSMVATLDRQQFEESVDDVPAARRSLAIRSSDAVDAVDAWHFFATEEDAEELRGKGWRFWVSAEVDELDLPTHPPILIGYFAGTPAEVAAEQLAEDEELHPAFSVSALSRETAHCEIQILYDRDLEAVIERASLASELIGGSSCDLCVVLLREALPERTRMKALLGLRDALGASGLLVGKGDANDALKLTRTLIHEFTEEKPLWQQHFKTRSGPAMLLCDERMATHRLTSWTPETPEEAPSEGAAAKPKAAAPVRGHGLPAFVTADGTPVVMAPPGGAGSRQPPADWSAKPRRRRGSTALPEPRRTGEPDGSPGKSTLPPARSPSAPRSRRVQVPLPRIARVEPEPIGGRVEPEQPSSGRASHAGVPGAPLPADLRSVTPPTAPGAPAPQESVLPTAPSPSPDAAAPRHASGLLGAIARAWNTGMKRLKGAFGKRTGK